MNSVEFPETASWPSGPNGLMAETSVSFEGDVRICRTLAEIDEFRQVWSAWKGHRDSDIEFYLEFIRSHPNVLRPHIIVLYRDGRPDAMLVGRLERTHFHSKIGYIRFPGIAATNLSFSYRGFRGNASDRNGRELIASVMESLRRGEADAAFFHQAELDSCLYRGALELPPFACRDGLVVPATHHFMQLPEDTEQLYAGLSGKHRKHLRSEGSRLLRDFGGDVRVGLFQEPAELDGAIEQVEEIAKKTYQRGLGVGFEATPEQRRLLTSFARQGWLRIHILYVAGTPCAFSVGTVSERLYCCDSLGYDPRYSKYSLGTFLLTRVFEDLCKAGVRLVDFGPGEAEYKRRFGNQQSVEASVYIYAPTVRGLALNTVRTAAGLTDSTLKKLMERTNLLSRVKKLWRRLATQSPSHNEGRREAQL